MCASWKKVYDPDLLAKGLEEIRVRDSAGKHQGFEAAPYEDYVTVLHTSLIFRDVIPEVERRRIISLSIRSVATRGSISAKGLIGEISKEENSYFALPLKKFALASSLSIHHDHNLTPTSMYGASIRFDPVRFFAWGALAFLKDAVIRNDVTHVDLDPMWHQLARRVAANVRSGEYQKAVEEIEDFLIGLRLNTMFDPERVRTATKLLYHSKGQFRVADLADYCHLSVRQLQREFDEKTGVSPKTLARTIRFEAIRERLMFDPDVNLTDLAYEFGYTDQAHFIKDFKAFTGKTPSEFVNELREFQKIFRDNENVVFLQSPPTMPDYNADR